MELMRKHEAVPGSLEDVPADAEVQAELLGAKRELVAFREDLLATWSC